MLSAIRSRVVDYRSRHETGGLLVQILSALSLFVAFVFFFGNSPYTGVPLLVFLGVTLYGWIRYQPATAKGLTFLTTVATVSVLVLIIAFLFYESIPAFTERGLKLFTGVPTESQDLWPPAEGKPFSLLPMRWGTVITTILATLVAAPLGVGGALFISEIAPNSVREVVKPGIELMAGIPSITYGFIGFVIINDYFKAVWQTPTLGNYFVAGLMIGLMALPTVVSVAEDALSTVPESMKGGSLAVGSTRWQTMKGVTVPAAFSGISAAVILGIGRAMGETMAATVILTHNKGLPKPLFDVFSPYGETLTTVIAFEGGNASGIHLDGLFAAGVVLFVMVMALSITSQVIEARMKEKLGGEQ